MIDCQIKKFHSLKKLIIECVEKNEEIILLDRAEQLKMMAMEFHCREQSQCIEAYIKEWCRKNRLKDIEQYSEYLAQNKKRFSNFEHHFYMLAQLKKTIIYYFCYCIVRTLNYYGINFSVNVLSRSLLEKVFKYGMYLFLVMDCTKKEEINNRIISNDYEKLLSYFPDVSYEIGECEIIFNKEAHRQIQRKIEKQICLLGGIKFLELCKNRLISSYDKDNDRYLIYRHKSLGLLHVDSTIPINYLIQIGLKNIGVYPKKTLNQKETNNLFEKVCHEAQAYMYLLNLSSTSIFEEICLSYKELPRYISRNLIYEFMMFPDQYSVKYLLKVINEVFLPIAKKASNELGIFVENYYSCANIILTSQKSIFTDVQLTKLSGIKLEVVKEILKVLSINHSEVNNEFFKVGDETDAQTYALIRLDDEKYYMFDARMSAFGFYCRLHNYLKINIGNFNSKLGNQMENFVRCALSAKDLNTMYGKYSLKKGTMQECDGIIEYDDCIIGLEMKYTRLMKNYSTGDDVTALEILGRGMLRGLNQNLQHWYDLMKQGSLELINGEKRNTLKLREKRLFSVSICSSEYRFFSDYIIIEKIINALIRCKFSTSVPERRKELDMFYEQQQRLRDLIKKFEQDDNGKKLIKNILSNVLFLSVPQLYMMCEKQEELLSQIKQLLNISKGTLDIYAELKI